MHSEFEFIQNIKNKYGLARVGDDCAVLPKDDKTDMVVTTDMLVEDIDFRLDWTTPEFLGHKALAVSLSDIAAMGATPKWAMLSVGVPKALWKDKFLDGFYSGYDSLAKKSHVELAGGDISQSDKFVVDSIIGGDVPKGKAILRSAAEVGDAIVVTHRVGGSRGGLRLLENGRRLSDSLEPWEENLLLTHLQPWPQVGIGSYLQNLEIVRAMIDISDGLASDLSHICESSKVGAKLYADKIPLDLSLPRLTESFEDQMHLALNGGEDFQLLFTVPAEKFSQLSAGLIEDENGLFTVIGEITANIGIIELVRDGKAEILKPQGYRHF